MDRNCSRSILLVALLSWPLLAASSADASARQARNTPAPASKPSVEQDVVAASNEWYAAVNRGDAAALETIEADDFMSLEQRAQGVVMIPKQTQLESVRKAPPGSRVSLQRELGNVRVRTYGPVALLTAVAKFRGTNTKGAPIAVQAVVTELWVNTGGHWRISHFQTLTAPLQPAATTPAK